MRYLLVNWPSRNWCSIASVCAKTIIHPIVSQVGRAKSPQIGCLIDIHPSTLRSPLLVRQRKTFIGVGESVMEHPVRAPKSPAESQRSRPSAHFADVHFGRSGLVA